MDSLKKSFPTSNFKSMKNFLKNKMLKRTLLGLSLALVMIGGVFVYRAVATVSSVSIDSPTAGTKDYVQSGGTVDVQFDVVTDALGDGTLRVEIYSGTTVIGDTLTTAYSFLLGDNLNIVKSIPISAGADAGSYDVKVTSQQPGGGTVITDIEVGAVVVDNTNPGAPTILTPNASGLYLKGGSIYAITWTPTSDTNLGATPIKIDYAADGSTFNVVVSAGTANDGTFDWTVPASDLATAKIRITATDLAGNTAVSTSANAFTIDNTVPAIQATTLLTPSVAGIKLQGGDTYNVTWTTGDITDDNIGATPISIEYSPDGTFTDTVVATSSITNSGTYTWTIPASDLATAKIRVVATDLAGNISNDPSAEAFLIDSTIPTVDAGTYANPINIATAPGATASDAGAGIATYAWTSASGTVIFSNAAILNPDLSAATDDSYVALLTVTDSAGNIGTSSVAFTWDVTPPVLTTSIIGSTIQGANDTITLTFDGPVQPQDGTWSANDIEYIKSPATSSAFTLTNATFNPTSGATTTLTITLNEATDNMFLRNENIIVVKSASNKIKDAAGNFVANSEVIGTTANAGDSSAPTLSSIAYSQGGLAVTVIRPSAYGLTVRVTATFNESMYSAPTIAIDAQGVTSADVTATPMTPTSPTVWYYDWTVPNIDAVQGAATITLAGTDFAGISFNSASTQTVTIDEKGPVILNGGITLDKDSYRIGQDTTVAVTVVEDNTASTVTVNGASAATTTPGTWAGTFTHGQTSVGTYSFDVVATDAYGNITTQKVYYRVVAATDTNGPTISGIATSTTQTTAAVTFTSSENGQGKVAYSVSGVTPIATNYVSLTAAASTTINLAGLTCGTTYNYNIYAKDGSGNETTSADATFETNACTPGDTSRPTIEGLVSPESLTDVVINSDITIGFSEIINTATLSGRVHLYKVVAGGDVEIILNGLNYGVNATTSKTNVGLRYSNDLIASTSYYVVVDAGVADTAGNGLLSEWTSDTFTTAAEPEAGLTAQVMGLVNYGSTNGGWDDAYEWVIAVTLPGDEANLAFQFDNWTNGLDTAGNMRYWSEEIASGTIGSLANPRILNTANSYTDGNIIITGDNSNDVGIQTNIHVQLKIPGTTPAGAHSSNFKVRSQHNS